MAADKNEIVTRLEALQNDIRTLNWMLSDVKGDDFRRMVSSKMTELLSDTNVQRMESNLHSLTRSSSCPNREACLQKMREVLAMSVDRYRQEDIEGAMVSLRELEGVLCSGDAPCKDSDCSQIAQNLLRDTKITMEISEKLKSHVTVTREPKAVESDPEDIARALDPLSYPARVRILQNLNNGESSFSDLSVAIGLRTGHLQHHLRPLCDAGYVSRSNGRGRYAITVKGRKALEGIGRLVASLNEP